MIKIIKYDDKKDARKFLSLYLEKVLNGEINSEITDIFDIDFAINNFDNYSKLFIAEEYKTIKGIMIASSYFPKNRDELENILENTLIEYSDEIKKIHLPLHRYSFNKKISYVERIETYDQKKGIGKKLIEQLYDFDTECIFLQSVNEARTFYKKLGFEETLGLSENIYLMEKHLI